MPGLEVPPGPGVHTPAVTRGHNSGEWIVYCHECSNAASDWVDHQDHRDQPPEWPPHNLVDKAVLAHVVVDNIQRRIDGA